MKAKPPSTIDVLLAISDKVSIDIITSISNHVTKPEDLVKILKITPKQYYSRTSRLRSIGIVTKKNGEIILTSFGRIIYGSQLKIATAFTRSLELRIVDAIKTASGITEDQQKKIIDKLLDDTQLKELIVKSDQYEK